MRKFSLFVALYVTSASEVTPPCRAYAQVADAGLPTQGSVTVASGTSLALDTNIGDSLFYDSLTVEAGGTIYVTGASPLSIYARDFISIAGLLDASGGDGGNAGNNAPAAGGGGGGGGLMLAAPTITIASTGVVQANGGAGGDGGGPGQSTFSNTALWGDGAGGTGGAGGYDGGAGASGSAAGSPGNGPGASGGGAYHSGVPPGPGGAGYATVGTDGFSSYAGNIQAGGPAYGDAELSQGLLGGSGAGGGGNDPDNEEGAGGGGSGGTIWISADALTIYGTVTAVGGQGGTDDYTYSSGDRLCCNNGGPGANGRIRMDYVTKDASGSTITPSAGYELQVDRLSVVCNPGPCSGSVPGGSCIDMDASPPISNGVCVTDPSGEDLATCKTCCQRAGPCSGSVPGGSCIDMDAAPPIMSGVCSSPDRAVVQSPVWCARRP